MMEGSNPESPAVIHGSVPKEERAMVDAEVAHDVPQTEDTPVGRGVPIHLQSGPMTTHVAGSVPLVPSNNSWVNPGPGSAPSAHSFQPGPRMSVTLLETTEDLLDAITAGTVREVRLPSKEACLTPRDMSAVCEAMRSSRFHVRVLSLQGTGLGTEGAEVLAGYMLGNYSVVHMDVSDNSIRDQGAKALAESLTSHPGLLTLNVSRNEVGSQGGAALAGLLRHNSILATVDLSHNSLGIPGAQEVASALAANRDSAVTRLDLTHNHMRDAGVSALARALRGNRALSQLSLKNNCVTAKGCSSLANVLGHAALTTLDLSSNECGTAGAKVLATALGGDPAPSLAGLNISYNLIGDEGMIALCEAAAASPALKVLDLSGNDGTPAVGTVVDRVLRGNTALERLYLGSATLSPALHEGFERLVPKSIREESHSMPMQLRSEDTNRTVALYAENERVSLGECLVGADRKRTKGPVTLATSLVGHMMASNIVAVCYSLSPEVVPRLADEHRASVCSTAPPDTPTLSPDMSPAVLPPGTTPSSRRSTLTDGGAEAAVHQLTGGLARLIQKDEENHMIEQLSDKLKRCQAQLAAARASLEMVEASLGDVAIINYVDYDVEDEKGKRVARYSLEIMWGNAGEHGSVSIIQRRYSEFLALHQELGRTFRGQEVTLPVLPPKKYRPTSSKVCSRRCEELKHYLAALLGCDATCRHPLVLQFLRGDGRGPSRSTLGAMLTTSLIAED